MRKLLAFPFLYLILIALNAQNLIESRRSSEFTYVFKVSNHEAKQIHASKKWAVDSSFFHTLIAQFPTDSILDEQLADGHYLKVHGEANLLKVEYVLVQHFTVDILNNSTDLNVSVLDMQGVSIADARVRVHGKRLHYDAKTKLYRHKKSNKKGLLEVTVGDLSAYYQLDRTYDNSWTKRVYRKVMFGSPVQYVWRPVNFIVHVPVDGVKSIIQHYPMGTISRISRAPANWYNRVACLVDPWYCNDWRFSQKYKGYLAFSKPKYQPGDTVKFKAFITKTSGKPLKKKVYMTLYGGGHSYNLAEKEPYAPGGYAHEFVLDDSLDLTLDKRYSVSLDDNFDRTFISNSFQYEEYELGKLSLDLEVAEEDHFRGDTLEISVKATDENELNVMDGRLEVLVTSGNVFDVFQKSLFVPDTLADFEMEVDPKGTTQVMIPDSYFPKVNMSYRVQVTLRSSDNERLVESINQTFYERKYLYDYELKGDSIYFTCYMNGVETVEEVSIKQFDAFHNLVEEKVVSIPARIKISPFLHTYQLEKNDTVKVVVELREEDAGVQLNVVRTNDSLFVRTLNPRKIPLIYYLYYSNKELRRGKTEVIHIDQQTKGAGKYHLSVQYLWGGKVREENYEIPLDKQQLKVEVNAPKVVYPGQITEVEVLVKDYQGEPVSGVDILAQGMTMKFKSRPESMPVYSYKDRPRKLINTFRMEGQVSYKGSTELDYDRWNPLMALDSIAYYHFLYPDSLYRYEYATKDSITQFSPFVVKDGVLQPIGVIYVDHVPVYFSWMADQPYSFQIDSGYHTVRIRCTDQELLLKDIYFSNKQKTILSVDAINPPESVIVNDVKSKYSKYEISNLSRYVMPYRYTFHQRYGYVQQGDRYFHIAPNKGPYVLGPMREKWTDMEVFGDFSLSFMYEERFEYEFDPRLMKMRSKNPGELLPEYVTNHAVHKLADEVWTRHNLKQQWDDEVRRRRLVSRRYWNPKSTSSDEGKLVLHYQHPEVNVLNTLVIKKDESDFFRVYPEQPRSIHSLGSGIYQLVYLYGDSLYAVLDSIHVQTAGVTHIMVGNIPRQSNKAFISQINEQLDWYFQQGETGRMGKLEKEKLKQTYQKAFQYFGPGDVVEGTVYDESSGESIPGVSVIVKGTSYGTVTDIDGHYSIKVPYDYHTLVFSFIGMSTEEVSIHQGGDVSMTADVQQLEEVIVIGYGVTEKKSLTASVSHVLNGQLAGVQISGVAGSSNQIAIRGASSVSSDQSPLVVIDGVVYQGDLSKLGVDISSIEILKTSEMTALYGSRAAGGVILISRAQIPSKNLLSLPEIKSDEADFVDVSQSSIRSNFSDEAFWQPSLRTDKEGKATFQVTFPDDITNWSTFIYAMNGKRQSGFASQSIKSYKPLSAQLSLPRFGVLGDAINVIGKALNYGMDTLDVTTSFEVNQEIKQQQLRLVNAHIDTMMVSPATLDSVEVKYMLTRADGYFDGEVRKMPIYPVGVEKNVGHYAALRQDTSMVWEFPDSLGEVRVYASGPSRNLLKNQLNYLVNYPYSCNEQLASRLKALLLLQGMEDAIGLRKVRDKSIKKIIKKLENNQNEKGLWGWWNQSSSNYWISVQVSEALRMARESGYEVSVNRDLIGDQAAWYLSGDGREGCFDWLYIAQCFNVSLNYPVYIQQLEKRVKSVDEMLRFQQILQQQGMSINVNWLLSELQTDLEGRTYFRDTSRYRSFYSNQKVLRTGLAIKLLHEDSAEFDEIIEMQDYLFEQIVEGGLNTYTLSNTVEALMSSLPDSSGVLQNELWINDRPVKASSLDTLMAPQKMVIRKGGRFPIYISGSQSYWVGAPVADSSSFSVRSYLQSGSDQLKAGSPEQLIVEVVVKGDQEYVMIEVPIPAGCSYESKNRGGSWEVHREYFKEKVSIFCRKLPEGRHRFEVKLLPRYAGKYTLNPAKAELMYFPVFVGHEGVKRLVID